MKRLIIGSLVSILLLATLVTLSLDLGSAEESKIGKGIKNIAKWWGNDEISDNEFLAAMKYLIEKNILKIEMKEQTAGVTVPKITGQPVVKTDKAKYKEGETITFSGGGFHNGQVSIEIVPKSQLFINPAFDWSDVKNEEELNFVRRLINLGVYGFMNSDDITRCLYQKKSDWCGLPSRGIQSSKKFFLVFSRADANAFGSWQTSLSKFVIYDFDFTTGTYNYSQLTPDSYRVFVVEENFSENYGPATSGSSSIRFTYTDFVIE